MLNNPRKRKPHGRAAELIKEFTSPEATKRLVKAALQEDLGPGDLTTCLFDQGQRGDAVFIAKADGVLSGQALANAVFLEVNPDIQVQWAFTDGDSIAAGDKLAGISGRFVDLLLGERVALNFLQRMSGIATLTKQYVQIAARGQGSPGIYDTRKTTPLLRAFEKKAVVDGGGCSHRFALYDAAMLKDNHIDAAGSITAAVERLRTHHCGAGAPMPDLCIEVRNIPEALEAAGCRADVIMLDNMSTVQVREAAAAIRAHASTRQLPVPDLEISGGITLDNLAGYADLPVDRISIGALTHSARALDISMKIK